MSIQPIWTSGCIVLSGEEYSIQADDLFGLQATARNRTCYVLHSAFCCSTLPARYLQLIPLCFVLKEPRLLTDMAMAMPAPVADCKGDTPIGGEWSDWTRLLDLSVNLP